MHRYENSKLDRQITVPFSTAFCDSKPIRTKSQVRKDPTRTNPTCISSTGETASTNQERVDVDRLTTAPSERKLITATSTSNGRLAEQCMPLPDAARWARCAIRPGRRQELQPTMASPSPDLALILQPRPGVQGSLTITAMVAPTGASRPTLNVTLLWRRALRAARTR